VSLSPELEAQILEQQQQMPNSIAAQLRKPSEIPAQPMVADEIPQTPSTVALDISEVTDEEIIETAVKLLKDGKTDAEIRMALLDEVENVEQDADEFIKTAHAKLSELLTKQEAEIEAAQASEDYANKIAMEATDKRLEAEREADKQLVEKVYAQGRLKKPVAPRDIERMATIVRMEEEEEAMQGGTDGMHVNAGHHVGTSAMARNRSPTPPSKGRAPKFAAQLTRTGH